MNHGADVTQLGGASFEFGGGGLRVAGRQGRERAEAGRMRADGAGGLVVGVPGQRDGLPAGRPWVAGVTTDRIETSIPVASIASTRPWPMSSSRAWLSPMVLKATLSSRPVRQAVERVADAGAVPVLFDRDDLHVHVLQVIRGRPQALPADGLTLVVQVLQPRILGARRSPMPARTRLQTTYST